MAIMDNIDGDLQGQINATNESLGKLLKAQSIPSGISTIKGLADSATVDSTYYANSSSLFTDYPEELTKVSATVFAYITIKAHGVVRHIEIVAVTPNGVSYTMNGYTATDITVIAWGSGTAKLSNDITALNSSLSTKMSFGATLNTDANTLRIVGSFIGTAWTNTPAKYGVLTMDGMQSNYYSQEFFDVVARKFYKRGSGDGGATWSKWTKSLSSDDFTVEGDTLILNFL